jgi:hypothetical protein
MAESSTLVFPDSRNGTGKQLVSTVVIDRLEQSDSFLASGNQRHKAKTSVMTIRSHELRVLEPFVMPTSTLVGSVGPNQEAKSDKVNRRLHGQSDHTNQVQEHRDISAYFQFALPYHAAKPDQNN